MPVDLNGGYSGKYTLFSEYKHIFHIYKQNTLIAKINNTTDIRLRSQTFPKTLSVGVTEVLGHHVCNIDCCILHPELGYPSLLMYFHY